MAGAVLPQRAAQLLIWHQGALGDVLLAGPALQALARHYPQAQFTLVGEVERLSLFQDILPVAAVWSSQRAFWLDLFLPSGPVAPSLKTLLAPFDLAVVFAPEEDRVFQERLQRAGLPHVVWLPSFPRQECRPVHALQQERLQMLGVRQQETSWRLALPPTAVAAARQQLAVQSQGRSRWLALAPGSGHPLKNWPLASYLELARHLEEHWQAEVWWLLGPAERGFRELISAQVAASAGQHLLTDLPPATLAAYLINFQIYVGNDSGLSHLAVAVGVPQVAVIFGPSEPRIWAPPGATVITAGAPCAPCTWGREISCPEPVCLTQLSVAAVSQALTEKCRGQEEEGSYQG
ncbi:MAG: glycosyltransferase family 9 protein [Desulfobacca sp.]|uniref:glycosyltransferase family 9 protein n=1 Tax=Desulfobacca sp. TaxID=2067990 RepID=UPI00404AFF07